MRSADIQLIYQQHNYTCNATCVAMLCGETDYGSVIPTYASLEMHGDPGCPYNLNAELTQLLRDKAAVSLNTNASLDELDKALDEGKACMTHGYFTKSGHIIVVVGRNETGYVVLDPWSEFNAATFSYDLGGYGFKGVYSRALLWATCVTSDSLEQAYSAYDGGWDWSDNSEKGMWLHTVDYVNNDEPLQFAAKNVMTARV